MRLRRLPQPRVRAGGRVALERRAAARQLPVMQKPRRRPVLLIFGDLAPLTNELNQPQVMVSDRDGPNTVNVASDETLIRSMDRLGFVSIDPAVR